MLEGKQKGVTYYPWGLRVKDARKGEVKAAENEATGSGKKGEVRELYRENEDS